MLHSDQVSRSWLSCSCKARKHCMEFSYLKWNESYRSWKTFKFDGSTWNVHLIKIVGSFVLPTNEMSFTWMRHVKLSINYDIFECVHFFFLFLSFDRPYYMMYNVAHSMFIFSTHRHRSLHFIETIKYRKLSSPTFFSPPFTCLKTAGNFPFVCAKAWLKYEQETAYADERYEMIIKICVTIKLVYREAETN